MERLRLGVLGGTFNPIHLGHCIIAEAACRQLTLDRILWVLTPAPPHKHNQAILGWADRLQMLRMAVAGNPQFEISWVDIVRQPPTYTRDTINILGEQHPNAQLFFLIGSDSLVNLPGWYHPRELVAACTGLGVMQRSGTVIDRDWLEAEIPGIFSKIIFLSAPGVEISSSEIRRKIARGEPCADDLHPEVYEYIHQHKFYST